VGIGILSFNQQGEVQIVNAAAKRLLRINVLRNIQRLEPFSPELLEQLRALDSGQNALVRVRTETGVVQLAIYAISLHLRGEAFKLVTIQNINSELEEKEMEAWQNLIRVLTHEIMNSVTPVSSLAGILESELDDLRGRACDPEQEALEDSDFEDVQMAIQTIKRRTEGLIRFVNDFRNLANMPAPRLQHVPVADIFARIKTLMAHEIQANDIVFSTHLDPQGLLVTADEELIEQVLINLIKNAIQALEAHDEDGKDYKSVSLIGRQDVDNRPVITVKDNGPGIDPDAIDRIFIPFFTTKKNGSGIGLSLSRQIMRLHKGSLTARSKVGVGTEFDLKF
jgi:nitrogen fixation/metabolism regulation signal transduction histidine kinase